MRPPRDGASEESYPRPQQPWQCGLADQRPPCPLGPDGHGCCPQAAACHPLRDGDRWVCNRSPQRGGPCAAGPGHDGLCAVAYRCTPVRALRARRGRIVAACLAAALGAACMAMSGSWRNEVIAPGPLSVHHANLLDGTDATMRCAQCHAAANGSAGEWLGVTATSAATVSQTALCMKCHDATISPALAAAAHNVPAEWLLVAGESGSGRRDAAAPIACAACHREHQGREHDLAAIGDAACQACHRKRYHSFAEGHPDFGMWPYVRRTRIAFDHASHQLKHYPAEKRAFGCVACHESDATGARQMTRSYEATCAACHDKAIAVSLAGGVPLVTLPTLDSAALAAAGHDMGPWPAEADGDFDGAVPGVAMMLMAGKPRAAGAMRRLGAGFDFFDLDVEDDVELAATADVAVALRELVDDLATRGQAAIAERLDGILGRDLQADELQALGGGFSPDAIAAYRGRWFGETSTEDATLSLKYQPAGHADPWLRAWLDVLAEAATGTHADVAEPLLRAALQPTAPGQCGSCHSAERDAAGRLAIPWRAYNGAGESPGLTRFSHEPHTLPSQLRDCTACHRVSVAAITAKPYAGDDPRQFVADFEPMTKASCVACHTAGAAGNACTQCHRYHGHVGGAWRPVAAGGPGAATLQPSR